MNDLSAKEEDLLQRVQEKPELASRFFRQAKSLKWFYRLKEAGFFDPSNLSGPQPVENTEGHVQIPNWPPIEYLLNCVGAAATEGNEDYAREFLGIIEGVTMHAQENSVENYQVWWRFAEILSSLPFNLVEPKHVMLTEHWLDDRYDRSLVADHLGNKWLPSLLQQNTDQSNTLVECLLRVLFRTRCAMEDTRSSPKKECRFAFDYYYGSKIISSNLALCGEKLGEAAIEIVDSELRRILEELENDKWSSIWQPAIEDHEQNKYHEDAENMLVIAYRDALSGHTESSPDEAIGLLVSMVDSDQDTIVRIALNAARGIKPYVDALQERLVEKSFLRSNLRHEIWHFLHDSYPDFKKENQKLLLGQIESIADNPGDRSKGAIAYEQAGWLSALRKHGDPEANAYEEAVKIAGAEPEHPDFSSYSTSGWGGGESPYSLEELSSFDIDVLVEHLSKFQATGGWKEPTLEGLTRAFKSRIVNDPITVYPYLNKFTDLDLAHVHAVIEAFYELWNNKSPLPWEEIWPALLGFIQMLVNTETFWNEDNAKERKEFVANRNWIISSIGRLLEASVKSDDHAVPVSENALIRETIELLLRKQEGADFNLDSDAVSVAINSPRGHVIEALINLTLRECRIADKNNDEHQAVWKGFEAIYDSELERPSIGEYEFATLVTNYLPNFLYMDGEWLMGHLDTIFDQSDELRWSCAIQGYSYVSTVYGEIFGYLKSHGDLLKALDNPNLADRINDRFVQQIAVAFLNDFEKYDEEQSLTQILVERFNRDEIHQLIWFFWTKRGKKSEGNMAKWVELLPHILEKIDLNHEDGRKTASDLCLWAEFVEELNAENMQWLTRIAPYAYEYHHGYGFFENLARLSEEQPMYANDLWQTALTRTSLDYPEEAIRKLLVNLLQIGSDGQRAAKATVDLYVKSGNERVWDWFKEIQGQ